MSQPPPIKNARGFEVMGVALASFEKLSADAFNRGLKTYGATLMTNNGRNPFIDAKEELVDGWNYLHQAMMEFESLRIAYDSLIDYFNEHNMEAGGTPLFHWGENQSDGQTQSGTQEEGTDQTPPQIDQSQLGQ